MKEPRKISLDKAVTDILTLALEKKHILPDDGRTIQSLAKTVSDTNLHGIAYSLVYALSERVKNKYYDKKQNPKGRAALEKAVYLANSVLEE